MMFELASALGIANSTNRTLILEENFLTLSNIFPRVKLLNFLSSTMIKSLIEENTSLDLVEDGFGIYSESMLRNYSNEFVVLHSSFCSYKYFQAINHFIKELFGIRQDLMHHAQNFLHNVVKLINNTHNSADIMFVGVHVRRGDFLNKHSQELGRIVATKLYLRRAMGYFSKKYKKVVFIVASDDMNWCKNNLPIDTFRIMFSPFRTSELDFTLLTQCNHSLISTGTFGWWAAYLTGGEVVYQRELSKRGSIIHKQERREDRIPKEWIPISGY